MTWRRVDAMPSDGRAGSLLRRRAIVVCVVLAALSSTGDAAAVRGHDESREQINERSKGGHMESAYLTLADTQHRAGLADKNLTAHPPSPTLNGTGNLVALGLPVGQGDCTVLVCPEHDGNVIIYDMGSTTEYWTVQRVRQYLEEETLNGVRPLIERLTTIIISHAHFDHYGYIPDVFPLPLAGENPSSQSPTHPKFKKPQIHAANMPMVFYGGKRDGFNADMRQWLDGIGEKAEPYNNENECILNECLQGTPQWTPYLCGPTVDFRVIAANMGNANEKNEQSVVLKVSHGTNSVLLVGDFEGTAQGSLLEKVNEEAPGILVSDVYKVSHHGASSKANYPTFLQAISPRHAFVSSAHPEESQYDHPRCETVDRLLALETLMTTSEHRLDCGVSQGEPIGHRDLQRSIYSTAPVRTEICVVQVDLPASGQVPHPHSQCQPRSAAVGVNAAEGGKLQL